MTVPVYRNGQRPSTEIFFQAAKCISLRDSDSRKADCAGSAWWRGKSFTHLGNSGARGAGCINGRAGSWYPDWARLTGVQPCSARRLVPANRRTYQYVINILAATT